MPIKELAGYYEQLVRNHPDEVAPLGWTTANIGYVAVLDTEGALCQVVKLVDSRTKRMIVPQQESRSSNIFPYFLCDNSSYVFGLDEKGNARRTAKCFNAARSLHHEILDGCQSVNAKAILAYFDSWKPNLETLFKLAASDRDVVRGRNIVFKVRDGGCLLDPILDDSIRTAWAYHISQTCNDSIMRCLVTGKVASVERVHPPVKGVYGADKSGAKLVSFNERAFESYGHVEEQGKNAPVSKEAAHAYTSALNYLLSKPDHHVRLGDTTVVYWADKHDDANASWFSLAMGSSLFDDNATTEDALVLIDATMKSIARGAYRDLEGIDPDATFFVLGLAPSAARLVVKFFFKVNFGSMLDNLGIHYRQCDIAHSPYERDFLTPFQLIREVENPKAKKPVIAPVLAGPLLSSMIQNTLYPQALYSNALLRIHAEQEVDETYAHKVSRGRASIIRAYLLRNCNKKGYDERGLTVSLNQERNATAYNLGRAFSIFAGIQEEANGKETITNRYFNAASTTPLAVYPILIRLSNAHLAKIERAKPGLAFYYRRILDEVFGEERVGVFPKRFTLDEQGDFVLGYYHQRQDRYSRKAEADSNASIGEKE